MLNIQTISISQILNIKKILHCMIKNYIVKLINEFHQMSLNFK